MSTTIPTPAEDAARNADAELALSRQRLAEAEALRADAEAYADLPDARALRTEPEPEPDAEPADTVLAALRDFAAALLPVMERAHQTAGEALADLRATVEREQVRKAQLDTDINDRRQAETERTND